MSADNGVYIAKFRDCIRVAHAQAIENTMSGLRHNAQQYQRDYFGNAYSFLPDALEAAFLQAMEIYLDVIKMGPCEYGIQMIEFPHDFPANPKNGGENPRKKEVKTEKFKVSEGFREDCALNLLMRSWTSSLRQEDVDMAVNITDKLIKKLES